MCVWSEWAGREPRLRGGAPRRRRLEARLAQLREDCPGVAVEAEVAEAEPEQIVGCHLADRILVRVDGRHLPLAGLSGQPCELRLDLQWIDPAGGDVPGPPTRPGELSLEVEFVFAASGFREVVAPAGTPLRLEAEGPRARATWTGSVPEPPAGSGLHVTHLRAVQVRIAAASCRGQVATYLLGHIPLARPSHE